MMKKILSVIVMILLIGTTFTAAENTFISNVKVDPEIDPSFTSEDFDSDDEEFNTGESIVLNVRSYDPNVLTSNLVEDNEVPVYAFLSATSIGTIVSSTGNLFGQDIDAPNIETVYGGFQIENIRIKPADIDTMDYLAGSPKYVKPKKFTNDNAGYVYMILNQIEREEDIPEEIAMNFNAEVHFSEVTRLFNLAKTSLVLPVDGDYENWEEKLDSDSQYMFFGGRGLIRVREIGSNYVLLTVYSNKDLYWPIIGAPRAIADLKLVKGEQSSYIDLGETDESMLGVAKFTVMLDDIKDPSEKKALLSVNADGNYQNVLAVEGMSIYPGSAWKVDSIYSTVVGSGVDYTVILKNGGNTRVLTTHSGTQGNSDFLNKKFYVSSTKGVSGLYYTPADEFVQQVPLTQMAEVFKKYNIFVDVSEVMDSTASLNRVSVKDRNLKEVLYNTLPEGYYFIADGEKIVIKEYGTSDPCNNAEILDDRLEVSKIEDGKYDNDLLKSLYCTSIQEYKQVIDEYSEVEGSYYSDRARIEIANIYQTKLRNMFDVNTDEYSACTKQAVSILEGVSSEDYKVDAENLINEYQTGLVSNIIYGSLSLEDNDKSVYVELKEIQSMNDDEKPSVVISRDGATNTYRLGDKIFTSDQNEEGMGVYNWMISSIGSESVELKKFYVVKENSRARETTRTLSIGDSDMIDSSTIKIINTDSKKEAYLTITPGTGKPLISYSNFTIHIPIEKRTIKLNTEKIDDKIEKAKKLQEKLEKNIEVLDKILRTWNKVCYGVFAFIELKLLFSNPSGEAREDVIRGLDGNGGWRDHCAEVSGYGKEYSTIDECLMDNSDKIQEDIEIAKSARERIESDPDIYENQEWYTEAVSGYDGSLEDCKEYLGDEAFLSEESLQDRAYVDLLGNKGSPVFKSEVNSYIEDSGEIAGSFEKKQEGCKAAAKAVGQLDGKDENYKNTAALAAFESGVSQDMNEKLDIKNYPTIGSLNINYTNVGYALKKSSSEYVVYDRDGTEKTVKLLTYSVLANKILNIYVDDTIYGDSVKVEREDINEHMSANERNMQIVNSNGYLLYYSENNGEIDKIYAANPAYNTGELINDYSDDAHFVVYGGGEYKGLPYCIPYTKEPGNFIKVIEYSKNNDILTMQYWNVGGDGDLCTGDDILVKHESQFAYETGGGVTYQSLYSWANKYVKMTFDKPTIQIGKYIFKIKNLNQETSYEGSTESCFDVMDPNDCKLLFNVCDPVMCPPSRFNLGGRWQVDNVVQSGIIGSSVLGWGNGDMLPVCFTGIQASLKYWDSMLTAYIECLEAAQTEGKMVGICDKMRSVYICQILVNEVAAIFESKGGFLNFIGEKMFSKDKAGGGEYLKFKQNIENTQNAFTYFTTEYSQTAFSAFKGRSFKEVGATLCKSAIYGKLPAFDDFMSKLSTPEDPVQFFATMTTSPYSKTTGESAYQVYYHIYAGNNENIPRIVYSVQLFNSITNDVHYVTGKCEGVSATVENGGIADATIDCVAPSGFDQLCVVINGDRTCGFGQVGTSFSANYIKDLIIADESTRNITSEQQCYPTYSSTSVSFNKIGTVHTSPDIITPYEFGELSTGIRRVCSLENPGYGEGNTESWKQVGTCGVDNAGRSLGGCWLDMNSVSINDARNYDTVSNALDEMDWENSALRLGIGDFLDEEQSVEEYEKIISLGFNSCDTLRTMPPILNDFIDKSMSFKYRAMAQFNLGQVYYQIVDRCEVVGSKDVEVNFKIGDDVVFAEGDNFPLQVSSGDTITLTINGINPGVDFVKIQGPEFVENACFDSNGEIISPCTFTIEMDNNKEENIEIIVITNNKERFYKIYVLSTYTAVGQALVEEESNCDECGEGVFNRCNVEECHRFGATCYAYREKGVSGFLGSYKCGDCRDVYDCSQLNFDSYKCEGNRVCTGFSGINCNYDSSDKICKLSGEDTLSGDFKATDLSKLMKELDENKINGKSCYCGDNCEAYADFILKYSNQYGVDPLLVLAIMMVESSCQYSADSGRASGLMQVTEVTFNSDCAGKLKVNNKKITNFNEILGLDNAENNIACGISILKNKYNADLMGKKFENACYEQNRNKFYRGWQAALRGYNGWGCNNDFKSQDYYVENVLGVYETLQTHYDYKDNPAITSNTDILSCEDYNEDLDGCVNDMNCYVYSTIKGYEETEENNIKCLEYDEIEDEIILCIAQQCINIRNEYICNEGCLDKLVCNWNVQYNKCEEKSILF